jgi:polygalacturonase
VGEVAAVTRPFRDEVADMIRRLAAETHIYNVKDFGAYGDGVHDDTAAIQAAIDDASLIYIPDKDEP